MKSAVFDRTILAGVAGIFLAASRLIAGVIAGPVVNPANGHQYYLLDQSSWTAAHREAWMLGGHLAAIGSEAENAWIVSTFGTFGGVPRHLWIGYNDQATEGTFRWVNGQPTKFSNWAAGEPNNASEEDFAELLGAAGLQTVGLAGQWNDIPDAPGYPVYGVAEVAALPDTIPGIAVHPISGHRYLLLTAASWTAAQTKARQLGGDLATIGSAEENEFIRTTFGTYDGVKRDLWFGLSDAAQEGQFRWASGEASTYANWQPNEPNNAGGDEHYGEMNGGTGKWNDLYNGGLGVLGVVELSPPQLPTNGLIAYYNFDGNVEDHGLNGFGNSLSSEHLSFGPDRFGRSNATVCFNGYSSIARTAPNSLLTNGEVSVSLWAYLNNSSPSTLFNRFNNSTNSFWDDLSFFPNYPYSQKSFLVCNWSGADGNPLDGIRYIETDFPVKQWFHFAISVSKTNCVLYANGVEIGSMNNVKNHQNEIFQRLAGWSFGAQATTDGPGTVLNGCLDDAAVYQRTLTNLEVYDIYQMQKGPTAAISQAGNSAVIVTFGLYPGYTFQIQGSSDGGNNWVDVETSFVAIGKSLAKTFNVTSSSQLFRAVQID